jgi:hypothetical protein
VAGPARQLALATAVWKRGRLEGRLDQLEGAPPIYGDTKQDRPSHRTHLSTRADSASRSHVTRRLLFNPYSVE